MTPQDKITELYELIQRRKTLTIINIIGIVLLLASQILLLKYVPMEIMLFYPLVLIAWGVVLLTLIVRVNVKIGNVTLAISNQIRERHVRESRQRSGDDDDRHNQTS